MIGREAQGRGPDPGPARATIPLAKKAAALAMAALLLAGCTSGPSGADSDHGGPAGTESAAGIAGSGAEGSGTEARGTEGSGATGEAPPSSSTTDPAPEMTAGARPDCPARRCATVAMTGDLLLHEALWAQAAADARRTGKRGLDFGPILAAQQQYLDTADLAICQLETPLADEDGPYSGYPAFNAPPQILDAATAVGYDACTTASNHTFDYGTAGLERTLASLDARGLEHTGSYRSEAASGDVLILDTPAARVAVIEGAFSLNGLVPDAPWQVDMLDPQAMIAKAKQARADGAEIVLGAIHAGDEYTNYANPQQLQTAHALADSGEFSLIYGHHSHSVQPMERYNGTWIVYGLGNTIAAHATPNILNTEGLMVRAQFAQHDDGGAWDLARLDWLPATFAGPEHRWCPVSADALEAAAESGEWCISKEADAASRDRTRATVESMGAAGDIAQEWQLGDE
jgi:hypothetical protein